MPTFDYKGKSVSGMPVSGQIKARDRRDLEKILRTRKVLVTEATPRTTQLSFSFGRKKIRKVQISRFTRQFATMIGAGLPMVQCLDILSQQSESQQMKKVLDQVKDGVQSGTTLSEALSRHKKVYDDLYVNMVEAGEMGGALDVILVRLANYREKADSLTRKVKGALVYPSVVVIVAFLVTFIMLRFIVPIFAKMFSGVGAELPGPTALILGISAFLQSYMWAMVAALVLGIVGLRYYYRTDNGRLLIDGYMLKFPVIGQVLRKSAVARFTRTLGTLLSSGVSILDALEITAKTAGNRVIQLAVQRSVVSIAKGDTVTQPLKETGVFPPMVTQMISVGEKTGGLDDMLSKIADFYEEEVDAAVASLTSLIEPVIIVVMGVVIGFILVAMYLPMFDIIGKIG
ncbi:MAG: type II secretion system F family protein [candidate division Zixibacteria bacterium]|nr:type II secretion system F family protein [candidate division Zixibacteria bacterium]